MPRNYTMSAVFSNQRIQKYIHTAAWLFCFSLPFPFWNGRAAFFSVLIFLLWVCEGTLTHKLHRLIRDKLFILLLIFLGYNVLSLLWTDYLRVGIETLNPYKYFLLIIPPLVTSIPSNKVPGLIFAFILGVLIHAILAYAIVFFDITAPFASKIYTPYAIYGPFTAFSSLYFLNKLFQENVKTKEKLFCLIAAVGLVILLLIKLGRSGQLGFIVSLCVLIFLHSRRPLKAMAISAVVVMIMFSLILNLVTTKGKFVAIKNEMQDVLDHEDYTRSIGARIGFLLSGIEVSKQHPFFGSGIGDSRDALQRLYERGNNPNFYTLAFFDGLHNQYLTFLTKLGLVGLSLFVTYIVIFFKLEIHDKEMKNLSVIFIAMFSFNCFMDELMFMKPYNNYFAMMSALFMNLASPRRASPGHSRGSEPAESG